MQCLQIVTICLQVNIYQINFIQWFYENRRSIDKIYVIKTNNVESDMYWLYAEKSSLWKISDRSRPVGPRTVWYFS